MKLGKYEDYGIYLVKSGMLIMHNDLGVTEKVMPGFSIDFDWQTYFIENKIYDTKTLLEIKEVMSTKGYMRINIPKDKIEMFFDDMIKMHTSDLL